MSILYGDMPAVEFKALSLEALQRALATASWMNDEERAKAEKRFGHAGLCRTHVNALTLRVKSLWRWAEKHELLPAGSSAQINTVKGLRKNCPWVRNTPARTPTSRADLEKVLTLLPPPVACMIELQWLTGMRSGEVRIMRPCDIDQADKVWLYRPSHAKNDWRDNGRPRVVPIGPQAQQLMASWLASCASPDAYLFPPMEKRRTKKGEAPLASGDRCYSTDSYARAIARACKKAGVKLVAYGNRHAAKMRITREAGADAARAVLGHQSISTTQHYGELDVQHAQEVMERLG